MLRRGGGRRSAAALFVAAAVALGGCGSSGRQASSTSPPSTSRPVSGGTHSAQGSSTSPAAALEHAYVSLVRRVRPEVVEVSTSSDLGSGIVWDGKGDIVTNHHVVGSATTFTVTLSNGTQESAKLVGSFAPDDLAVLRVAHPKGLRAASFADSSSLQVGDIVFAIGNPLGLASSVTQGIVSYVGRTVGEGNGVVLPSTVQTSAPINPGNSGGALVDLQGQVVGIPTLAALDPQVGGGSAPGIGFAIPSNVIKKIVPQLIANGKVTNSGRAALGIEAADVTNQGGSPVGVGVVKVTSGSGAAKAGIKAGDVIVSVDGHNTPTVAALQDLLAGLSPGKTVPVVVVESGGARHTYHVTLGQLTG